MVILQDSVRSVYSVRSVFAQGEKKPPDSLAVFREFRVPYVH